MDASAMPKILYIDDNKSLTKLFFCLGEEYHFQALISNSLTEGLEIAIKEKPDVILIDIHMCDGTGLQYTAKLKTLKETAHIPVIGCSVTYFEDG
ncbi:MAG: response regulator, partial [Candidatus Aureabacteria bacterium]|nr:response regulator [Candidatus Auribacterota bacterium]